MTGAICANGHIVILYLDTFAAFGPCVKVQRRIRLAALSAVENCNHRVGRGETQRQSSSLGSAGFCVVAPMKRET